MAINKNNFFIEGVSGTIAKQMTLSQRSGKTIVGKKSKGSTLPPTESQIAIRERFEDASEYALSVLADPVQKAAYTEEALKAGMSAYALALKDAHSFPEVRRIITGKYKGAVADVITIRARDVFKLDNVRVVIMSAAGVLIEEGQAAAAGGRSKDWKYTATAANPALPGTRIIVTATDVPGNETVKEFVLT